MPTFSKPASAASRPVRGDGPRPQIMVHIDRGGDKRRTKDFYDKCKEHDVEFDVIGQSYYPWWHGSLADLRENLAFMANEYDKDIIVVEAAYNWRPAEYRDHPGPYPESPEGQKEFLERSQSKPSSKRPTTTARASSGGSRPFQPGGIASRGMFDNDGNALPVITVFDRPEARGLPVVANQPSAAGN